MLFYTEGADFSGRSAARPIQRQPGKVITDDLDYFLLQIASDHGIRLPMFEIPNLSECVGRHVPEYTRHELIAALVELFDRGDLEAEAELPHPRRRCRHLRLNAEDIEAGIAGAISIRYSLTPQGGERWARHAGVDWQRWDDDRWSSEHYRQITTTSREFSEFLFEREVRSGEARGPGKWREVRPWNATYWHVEPVGYQVRFRSKSRQGTGIDLYPCVWKDYLPWQGEQPVDLVARRQRDVPRSTRPLEALSEEQLHRRLFDRSPLTQLAADCERERRAGSVKELVDQLEGRSPISRYSAARALGERKAVGAIPALLGVVFNHHDVAAVEALGQIGDARVLEPLLVLYEHWGGGWPLSQDPPFFDALRRVIAQFGDVAIERIEQLHAEGRISLVRAGSAIGLSRSTRAVQFLARYMREERNPLMNLLARMGDEARGLLFAVANGEHEAWLVRYYAARELARRAGAFQGEAGRIVAALTESSKERELRSRVAYFVTGTWAAEVVDPVAAVLDVLRHSDADRRRIAVDLLVELNARHAAGEIAGLATDESWVVRASVGSGADALGRA